MNISQLTDKLLEAIKRTGSTPTAYDTEAEIVRIDGSTAWIHIPGGVSETPCKLTISASVGDKVQVRVGGGRAWITGNLTAPPTDDTTATVAKTAIEEQQQHFYSDGNGAHVKDSYGNSTDVKSDGMHINKDGKEVAAFLSNKIQLAKNSEIEYTEGERSTSRIEACNGLVKIGVQSVPVGICGRPDEAWLQYQVPYMEMYKDETGSDTEGEGLLIQGNICSGENIRAKNLILSGDIFLENHTKYVGYLATATNTSATSVGTSATLLSSFTLTAGTWIVFASCRFANKSNSTYRILSISNGTGTQAYGTMEIPAINGTYTLINTNRAFKLTADKEIKLFGQSGTASTGVDYVQMYAVRIA